MIIRIQKGKHKGKELETKNLEELKKLGKNPNKGA